MSSVSFNFMSLSFLFMNFIDGPLLNATFISRPNRFITRVKINNNIFESHLADPGRLEELLIPGAKLYVRKARKNLYTRTYIANKVMSLFFSIVNFYYISDVATCYKLMPTDFFKKTTLKESGFSIEIELLSKFLKYNRSVKEVPIKYEGRSYSEGKKIKTSDGVKYLLNTIRYRFIN